MRKYLVIGGWVTSQRNYLDPLTLISLYGVPREECYCCMGDDNPSKRAFIRAQTLSRGFGFIVLRPDPTGAYVVPQYPQGVLTRERIGNLKPIGEKV